MAVSLSVKKYNQEGDMAHEYRPLRNQLAAGQKQQSDVGEVIQPKDLIDFRTDEIDIDLNNPLNIECQPSYDGTVNLIINDDSHPPRIVNTRFTAIENNRYRIINRNQKEQTNIYEETKIDQQTRLFRNINSIPRIQLVSVDYFGQLKGGNYTFYVKFADNDFNKTDVVCESGQISIFNGTLSKPSTVTGTLQDERTDKSITISINNIDTSFQKVYLYYTRETCDINGVRISEAAMIKEPYDIKTSKLNITVNGFEEIEEINENELNIKYLYVDRVKTQTQNQGMLFFGNVEMTTIEPRDLQALSLFIEVKLEQQDNSIGYINTDYTNQETDDIEQVEYYNPQNIYYNLGYWPDEMYRLGIVYIMKDDSLSEVFNLRGIKFQNVGESNISDEPVMSKYKEWWAGAIKDELNDDGTWEIRRDWSEQNGNPIIEYELDESGHRTKPIEGTWDSVKLNYIPKEDFIVNGSNLDNIMGVFKLPTRLAIYDHQHHTIKPYGFKISIEARLRERLQQLGIKGFFIVRQKRIPTTLCQGLSIGIDRTSHVPILPIIADEGSNKPLYITEGFIDNNGTLSTNFKKKSTNFKATSALLTIDPCIAPILQSTFDGSEFVFQEFESRKIYQDSTNDRIFTAKADTKEISNIFNKLGTIYVGSDIPTKYMNNQAFSTRAGAAEEVKQVSFFDEQDYAKENRNLLRGIWCPILGLSGELKDAYLYNVKIRNFSSIFEQEYFKIRGNDNSPFFAITDRWALDDKKWDDPNAYIWAMRGDCYTCTVSIRLQRNFVDSDVPVNDIIIDPNTWKDNYDGYNTTDEDAWLSINRGDVNTVPIGSWITWKCLSNYNLGLRALDYTNVEEMALMGNPRSFYPITGAFTSVGNKLEDSWKLNDGYSSTVGKKSFLPVQDIPYTRDIFDTRIMFSNVQQDDAFQNAYRIFQGLSYKDMDRQYGGLVKLISWGTSLLAIFEHGITIIPVNEKALVSTTTGQSIHMYGAGVLQNQMTIISQDYGSIWQESIVRTPAGVYGVDTYAKKIWRFSQNNGLELISDGRIQRFLNDHIKLKEKDKYPTIALKNVKSHYNNYKGDIMFTFYNDSEEEEWNICYNERLDKWSTRYSWIPLYSDNVNNIYYSLDKKRAEVLAYIYDNINASTGVISANQDSNIWNDRSIDHPVEIKIGAYDLFKYFHFEVTNIKSSYIDENGKEIFVTIEDPNTYITWESNTTLVNVPDENNKSHLELHVIGDQAANRGGKFTIKHEILEYGDNKKKLYYLYFMIKTTPYSVVEPVIQDSIITGDITVGDTFNTMFGIVMDVSRLSNQPDENGEIEIEENDKIMRNGFYVHGRAGIFDEIDYFNEDRSTNDQIMPTVWYDKQEPFEFEFVVNEPTGLHKIFNNLVLISNNVAPSEIEYEIVGDVYGFNKAGLFWKENKSKEIDPEWSSKYNIPQSVTKDRLNWIKNLPSQTSEKFKDNVGIEWDPILNQYLIKVNQQCKDIKEYGRMKGNLTYKEDAWYLTIDPIYYQKTDGNKDKEGNLIYSDWKSTRIRDKWCKIRIKYTGKDLVLISAIKTMIMTTYS